MRKLGRLNLHFQRQLEWDIYLPSYMNFCRFFNHLGKDFSVLDSFHQPNTFDEFSYSIIFLAAESLGKCIASSL